MDFSFILFIGINNKLLIGRIFSYSSSIGFNPDYYYSKLLKLLESDGSNYYSILIF